MEQTADRQDDLRARSISVAADPAAAAVPGPAPQAAETRRLYDADWRAFTSWCRQHRHAALPADPSAVAAYLASLSAKLTLGALTRRAAAIADRHRRASHPPPGADPAVRAVLRTARSADHAARAGTAARRGRVVAKPRTRSSPNAAQLARMAARCPGDLAGLRDRALLLLRAAGLEAEPLLGLDREHVRLDSQQVALTLIAPDHGAGTVVVISRGTSWATCPVRALDGWLHSSDTRFGPVFRKVDRWGNVEHQRLRVDGLRRIVARRAALVRRTPVAADAVP